MKNYKKIIFGSILALGAILGVTATSITTISENNSHKIQIKQTSVNKNLQFSTHLISKERLTSVIRSQLNQMFNSENLVKSHMFIFAKLSSNKMLYYDLLLQKCNELINDVYSGKTTIEQLIKGSLDNFNKLTIKQKNKINELINKRKNDDINNSQYFSSANFSQFIEDYTPVQAYNQVSQNVNNFLAHLKDYAIAMTTLASATSIIVAAEWSAVFVGWIEAGFTTAALVADWAAVGDAWSTYHNIQDKVAYYDGIISGIVSGGIVAYKDLPDFIYNLREFISSVKNAINSVKEAAISAEAVGLADVWADPAQIGVVVIRSAFFTSMDTLMSILGFIATLSF